MGDEDEHTITTAWRNFTNIMQKQLIQNDTYGVNLFVYIPKRSLGCGSLRSSEWSAFTSFGSHLTGSKGKDRRLSKQGGSHPFKRPWTSLGASDPWAAWITRERDWRSATVVRRPGAPLRPAPYTSRRTYAPPSPPHSASGSPLPSPSHSRASTHKAPAPFGAQSLKSPPFPGPALPFLSPVPSGCLVLTGPIAYGPRFFPTLPFRPYNVGQARLFHQPGSSSPPVLKVPALSSSRAQQAHPFRTLALFRQAPPLPAPCSSPSPPLSTPPRSCRAPPFQLPGSFEPRPFWVRPFRTLTGQAPSLPGPPFSTPALSRSRPFHHLSGSYSVTSGVIFRAQTC